MNKTGSVVISVMISMMWLIFVVHLTGCVLSNGMEESEGKTSTTYTPSVTPSSSRSPSSSSSSSSSLASTPKQKAKSSKLYYTEKELIALGFTITSVNENQKLLCSGERQHQCFCWQSLACKESGDCIKFDENIRLIKAALNGQHNRLMRECSIGETGTCGSFRYFRFDGQLARREIRWFDKEGVIVGQRHGTDDTAFCGNKTFYMYHGKIPKCKAAVLDDYLCGERMNHRQNPIDSLMIDTKSNS